MLLPILLFRTGFIYLIRRKWVCIISLIFLTTKTGHPFLFSDCGRKGIYLLLLINHLVYMSSIAASEKLKRDKEVVLSAVENCGLALEFASEDPIMSLSSDNPA